jgi:hypothetical protein
MPSAAAIILQPWQPPLPPLSLLSSLLLSLSHHHRTFPPLLILVDCCFCVTAYVFFAAAATAAVVVIIVATVTVAVALVVICCHPQWHPHARAIVNWAALFPLHCPPHPPSCGKTTSCATLTEDQSLTLLLYVLLSAAIVNHMCIALMR